jgi:Mu-like prophage I protein
MAEETTQLLAKRVWIQLADVGVYKGHPMGPFQLTPGMFDTMVANFQRDGIPLPIDAEHASEMPPTSGSIPSSGAPAMGWIHQLQNRGNGGLWGEVEWLEPARTYIKEGRYKYISPAIKFKSKDRVTGQDTGPRLSSAGMTNTPFLTSLPPLVAKNIGSEQAYVMTLDGGLPAGMTEALTLGANGMCYSAHEFMPRIKRALCLPELATGADCSQALDRLREHLDTADGNAAAIVDGICLADYLIPLRHIVNPSMGATWDDVLETIDELIDSTIEEPSVSAAMSADGVPDTSTESDPSDSDPVSTSTESNHPAQPAAATEETTTMENPQTPAAPTAAAAPVAPAAPPAPAAPAPAPVTTFGNAEVATLTLKLQGAETENARLRDENTRLLNWKSQREEQDYATEVSIAYETYKDKKGLRPEDKAVMLTVLKATPEAFRQLYPAVPPSQAHLLRNLSQGPNAPTSPHTTQRVPADLPNQPHVMTMSVRQLSRQIARKRGISLAQAQIEANTIVQAQRRARAHG